MNRKRRGSALIEVLVSLVLLSIGGTALVTLLGQTAHSMQTAAESERLTQGASEQLDWLAIASRPELVTRSGRTMLRGWAIEVRQTSPTMFDITVAASDTGAPLVRTTLYRPDSTGERP
jgi:Tfp pilus assembly protein PilV